MGKYYPQHPILDWVQENVEIHIIGRGENYRLNVENLKTTADGWAAKVHGTDVYEVNIEHDDEGDFYCECDCPYDDYCKHIVAVAYEIADLEDKKEGKTVKVETKKTTPMPPKDNFYATYFAPAKAKVKEDFIRQMFDSNELLRSQFLAFAGLSLEQNMVEKTKAAIPIVTASSNSESFDKAEMVTEIIEEIESLSLDYDTFYEEGDFEYHYGYDEYDAAAEWGIEEVKGVLDSYYKKLNKCLIVNDLRGAIDWLIVFQEVGAEMEDNSHGEELWGDTIGSIINDEISDYPKDVVAFIESSVLSQDYRWNLISYLLGQWKGASLGAYLPYFNDVLIALNNDAKISTLTMERLQQHKDLQVWSISNLAFHVADKTENSVFWFETAKNGYQYSFEIASKYFNRLYQEGRVAEYHKLGNEIWKLYNENYQSQSELFELLKGKIDYEHNNKLYLAFYEKYAATKKDLTTYKTLKNYWTESQKERFIQSQTTNSEYYCSILEYEQLDDKLLDFVRNYGKNSGYGNSKYSLLKFIGNKYADEAFIIFKECFFYDEQSMKMDRSGYASYCSKLLYLKEINVTDAEKQVLVNRLRAIYPNRPAFLDELNKVAKQLNLTFK